MQYRFTLNDRDREPSLGDCPLSGRRIMPGDQKYVKHHVHGYLLMVHRNADYCYDDSNGYRYLKTFTCDHCGCTYRRGGNGQRFCNGSELCGPCHEEQSYKDRYRYDRYQNSGYGDPDGGSSKFSLAQLDKDQPLNFKPDLHQRRSILGDAWKFYTLRMLELAIDYPLPELVRSVNRLSSRQARSYSSRATTKLYQDIQQLKDQQAQKLADAMYNYIILASAGEARYALKFFSPDYLASNREVDNGLDPNIQFLFDLCDLPFGAKTNYMPSRSAIWYKLQQGSISLDSLTCNQFTRAITDLFNRSWRSSYGGSSWASIANALPLYHQNLDVFIDHGFDLQHNNGCAFNKGDIFAHCDVIKLFLDLKADAPDPNAYISMLAKHWKMIFGPGSYGAYDSLRLSAFQIQQLIHRACQLGLLEQEINNQYGLEFNDRYIQRNLQRLEKEFTRQTGITPTCYQEAYPEDIDKWIYWRDHYYLHPIAEKLAAIYQQLSGGKDQPEPSGITIEEVPF